MCFQIVWLLCHVPPLNLTSWVAFRSQRTPEPLHFLMESSVKKKERKKKEGGKGGGGEGERKRKEREGRKKENKVTLHSLASTWESTWSGFAEFSPALLQPLWRIQTFVPSTSIYFQAFTQLCSAWHILLCNSYSSSKLSPNISASRECSLT